MLIIKLHLKKIKKDFSFVKGCFHDVWHTPNSFKDSNVNPKMKTLKKGIGVRSLVHNTSRVKGACWSFQMGIKTSDKWVHYSYGPAQTKQQVG
jgi:hypothetical protein